MIVGTGVSVKMTVGITVGIVVGKIGYVQAFNTKTPNRTPKNKSFEILFIIHLLRTFINTWANLFVTL